MTDKHTKPGNQDERAEMIDTAVWLNSDYRDGGYDASEAVREQGYLYGCADLITAMTLKPDESFSETQTAIAIEIDREAAKEYYPLVEENGWVPPESS